MSQARHTTVALALALMALGGCQTKPIEQMSYGELRALADELVARCVAQGVGNAEMSACTTQEARRELTVREQNRQASKEFGDELARIGRGMMDPRFR